LGGYSPLHAAGAYQLRRRREAILERLLRAIGCETIYAFIYRTAQKAEALWRYLTRRHKRRRPRRARASRDTIKERASIQCENASGSRRHSKP
jgi:transposase, IS30 family